MFEVKDTNPDIFKSLKWVLLGGLLVVIIDFLSIKGVAAAPLSSFFALSSTIPMIYGMIEYCFVYVFIAYALGNIKLAIPVIVWSIAVYVLYEFVLGWGLHYRYSFILNAVTLLILSFTYLRNLKSTLWTLPMIFAVVPLSLLQNLSHFEFFLGLNIPIYKEPTESGSYTSYNILPFTTLMRVLGFLVTYVMVCYFLVTLKNNRDLKFPLFRCSDLVLKNRTQYSIIYWGMRTFLFLLTFALANYLAFYAEIKQQSRFTDIDTVALFLLFTWLLFAISVVYRNLIVSYFATTGRPLSWNYLLLNIPIINFFAWLISFKPSENSLENAKVDSSADASSNQHGKPNAFLWLLVLFSTIVLAMQSIGGGDDAWAGVGIYLVVMSVLVALFIQHHFTIYILLAIAFLTIFMHGYSWWVDPQDSLGTLQLQWLINFIIFVPVYHASLFLLPSKTALKSTADASVISKSSQTA